MLNVKKLIEAVRETIGAAKSLGEVIAAKKQEVRQLEDAPMPREDVIDAVCADVDRMADAGRENMMSMMQGAFSRYAHIGRTPLLEMSGTLGWESNKVFPQNIYFLFREPIKRAIRDEIMAASWPTEVGPRRRDRGAMIAKLKQEIADLELQQRDLQQEAKEAGVDLAATTERPDKYFGGQPGSKEAKERARHKA